jgi:3-deoxy-manno-octulosonate cytidylyltransferase (CMP-KDO synthetase)
MLADVGGVPLVVRTWQRVMTAGFARVVVATDDDAIAAVVRSAGGEVVRTGDAPNGTTRVAAAVAILEDRADVVLNVQGDEPLVEPRTFRAIADALDTGDGSAFDVATGAAPMDAADASRPERVKVVSAADGRALYFSRAPVPSGGPWRVHVGVYAFRPSALAVAVAAPPSPLEVSERLEQLRWMEIGLRVRVVDVTAPGPSVDTAADLEQVRAILCPGGSSAR